MTLEPEDYKEVGKMTLEQLHIRLAQLSKYRRIRIELDKTKEFMLFIVTIRAWYS